MTNAFDTTKFHEGEDFLVLFEHPVARTKIITQLTKFRFVIDDDAEFAYLERDEFHPPWQSSNITSVDFLLRGNPSSDPEPIDSVNFSYLLATLPEETIPTFAEIIDAFSSVFRGNIQHRGISLDRKKVANQLVRYVDELESELGDRPGTDFVARMIYEFRTRG